MMNETGTLKTGSLRGAVLGEEQPAGLHDRLANAVSQIMGMTVRLENVADRIHGGRQQVVPEAAKEPHAETYYGTITDLERAVSACDEELRRVENGL